MVSSRLWHRFKTIPCQPPGAGKGDSPEWAGSKREDAEIAEEFAEKMSIPRCAKWNDLPDE
jgi:hypothetical protein